MITFQETKALRLATIIAIAQANLGYSLHVGQGCRLQAIEYIYGSQTHHLFKI